MTNDIEYFSQYCERTSGALFAEPLNAFTNIAFIIAGLFAWRLYYQTRDNRQRPRFDFLLLIIVMFSIGAGSLSWHTLAKPWAELADAIPILLFIGIYILSFLYRIAGLNILFVVLIFIIFEVLNTGTILYAPRDVLNGSLFYIPTLLLFFVFAAILIYQKISWRGQFIAALLVFGVAIAFRTIDQGICQYFPLGTHFLWHILVALVLYLAFRFLAMATYTRRGRRH